MTLNFISASLKKQFSNYCIDGVHHYTRKDNVLIFAHNSGTERSIHLQEPVIQISDKTPCKVIQNGGGSIAKDFGQLKTRSLQYYKENDQCRFPPSIYLPENSTREWAEKLGTILDVTSVKIIVGFQPINYLTLVGLETNEYPIENATFNNSVIAVNPKKRWLMMSVVTDATDQTTISTELSKLNDFLKTVYHVNQSTIQNEVFAIVGILVTPNINSRSTLKNDYPIQMDQDCDKMFITKMEWDSIQHLKTWVAELFGTTIHSEIKKNSSGNFLFYVE